MSRKLFQYHPVIGYHFIPGLRARIEHEGGGYLVRVNQAGFRCDHEFERTKKAGAFRILVFGDSFTAGDGVSNKHRFTDLLESLLPGLEVYNFGLSGTGTDQQYLAFKEFGAELDHDLIVIALQIENIRRVAARYRAFSDDDGNLLLLAKPYFALDTRGGLTLHHVPPRKEAIPPEHLSAHERQFVDWGGRQGDRAWLRKVFNRLGPRAKDLAQRFTRYQPLPAYDRADHPDWLLLKAVLLKWIAESKAPVIVYAIPMYSYIEETSSADGYQARFREFEATPNVVMCDPLSELRQYPKAERRGFRFGKDSHPNPAGHRALAESLAKAIRPMMEA